MKKLFVLALLFGALVSCTPTTNTEVPVTDSIPPVDTVVAVDSVPAVDTAAVIVITNQSATDTVSE